VILVDTSAWVAWLRGDGSLAHRTLRQLIVDDADIGLTEPVAMELLAGGRGAAHRRQLAALIRRFEILPVWGLDDYEAAGDLWATLRRRGVTVRSIFDCLIACVAIRNDAPLLHADRDFAHIAEHTELRVYRD
jgi:predicted nucleic acid-binding protein